MPFCGGLWLSAVGSPPFWSGARGRVTPRKGSAYRPDEFLLRKFTLS